MKNAKPAAVVLSGGGAYGAYEAGVLLALARGLSPATQHRPLMPMLYAGTSVGAFNAAFLASRWEMSPDEATTELARVWRERIADQGDGAGNGVFRYRFDPREHLDLRFPLRNLERLLIDSAVLTRVGLRSVAGLFLEWRQPIDERVLSFFSLEPLITTGPLRRTLSETIDFGSLRRSSQGLRVAATDWDSGKALVFANDDMSDDLGPRVLQGSASIPGVFPAERAGPWLLVDGGVVMNMPLLPVIRAGAQELHLIRSFSSPHAIPMRQAGGTLGAILRAQILSWGSEFKYDLEFIRVVNRGLSLGEKLCHQLERRGWPPAKISEILEAASLIERDLNLTKYRHMTVHCHYPYRFMDKNPLALLNFARRDIETFIVRGYRDAIGHDCVQNGCLLPTADDGPAPQVGSSFADPAIVPQGVGRTQTASTTGLPVAR